MQFYNRTPLIHSVEEKNRIVCEGLILRWVVQFLEPQSAFLTKNMNKGIKLFTILYSKYWTNRCVIAVVLLCILHLPYQLHCSCSDGILLWSTNNEQEYEVSHSKCHSNSVGNYSKPFCPSKYKVSQLFRVKYYTHWHVCSCSWAEQPCIFAFYPSVN